MHMTPQVYAMNAALSRVLSITQIILVRYKWRNFMFLYYNVYSLSNKKKMLDATACHKTLDLYKHKKNMTINSKNTKRIIKT